MPRGKYYDEDDVDDGYYDDYDDGYDEDWEEGPAPPKPQQPPAKSISSAKTAGPAAAAAKKESASIGTSKSSQAAISKTAAAAAPSASPLASALKPPIQPFTFETPSPDDAVLSAQAGQSSGPSKSVTADRSKGPPGLPQSRFLQQQQHQPAPAASSSAASKSAADMMLAMTGLSIHGSGSSTSTTASTTIASAHPAAPMLAAAAAAAATAADSTSAIAERRRVSSYSLEPELAKECEAISAAEQQGTGVKAGLHLVVLGHVDAGKSTLMGRLLHDLGYVSQKEAHKTQKEASQAGKASFSWAWVMDERPEERARGVTIDVAMTRFQTSWFNVTLLDAPGHRDFVPNMISGAAQADAALLLVDGSPGGFEAGFEGTAGIDVSGGQTKEHAQLARSLGVEQVAVVISKLDTCNYSQERFESIRELLLPFLKSIGFKESALQWLPAVGPSGENLAAPPTQPELKAWWSGPTVVQAIDNFKPRDRNTGKPLRLPITDVYKAKTGALVVGGKLEGGALKAGTKVMVVPSNEIVTVKSVEVDGQVAKIARAGDSADVALTGVDAVSISSGCVLCHPEYPVPLVTKFEARIVVLDIAIPLLRGHQVTLHVHAAREAGHITALVSTLNPKTGDVIKLKPRCIMKGQAAVVEVSPARPMCLEEYSDYKALGRVALRDGGKTIAVGIVTRILS